MSQTAPTMLQLGPYSAWIAIEHVGQEVYCTEVNDAGNAASCWIASEQGKKFCVSWHNALRDVSLEAIVSIDGVICNRHVMLDGYNFPHKPNAFGISYARTSEHTRRDFVFSAIQVTDDDAYLDTLGNTTDFGIIQIDLWRLCVTNVIAEQPLVHEYGAPVLESQVLHERSKKAGTHHVKFGDEYVVPPAVVDRIEGYRMDLQPWISLTFRYRPLSMLMANGIAPRPAERTIIPNPPSNRAPRKNVKQEDSATAALEEIRNLEERIKSLRSAIPGQSTSENLDPHSSNLASRRRKVKQEEARSPPEVIDLT